MRTPHRVGGQAESRRPELGARRQTFNNSPIGNALRLIEVWKPATQVARDLGVSRATVYRWARKLPMPSI
jgi:DNA-binding phage protein